EECAQFQIRPSVPGIPTTSPLRSGRDRAAKIESRRRGDPASGAAIPCSFARSSDRSAHPRVQRYNRRPPGRRLRRLQISTRGCRRVSRLLQFSQRRFGGRSLTRIEDAELLLRSGCPQRLDRSRIAHLAQTVGGFRRQRTISGLEVGEVDLEEIYFVFVPHSAQKLDCSPP